jgi:hypothetical protein
MYIGVNTMLEIGNVGKFSAERLPLAPTGHVRRGQMKSTFSAIL